MSKLTPKELAALDLLTIAAGAIMALPECHPGDSAELVRDLHNIQNRVMARAAVRAFPELFNHVEGFE